MISQASTDPRFHEHVGVTQLGIESYIAVPLVRRDGSYFGTLCAFDTRPAHLDEEHLNLFRLLAALIGQQLEIDEQLLAEREAAFARERLLGVLGHDLRTPLTSVILGAEDLVVNGELRPDDHQLALSILGSARRASRMVTDLLDFTRARLAGGIPVDRKSMDLAQIAQKVVAEVRAGSPGREIRLQVEGDCSGEWDPDRAAQVVANLVANAVQHGAEESPIEVSLRRKPGGIVLEVENAAPPIDPATLADLFSPFRTTSARPDGGLGLGLFIVQQIMTAHGGSVDVSASGGRVRFTTVWP